MTIIKSFNTPDGEGPFPLVLLSHGLGDEKNWKHPMYGTIEKVLLSEGFAVARLQFRRLRDSEEVAHFHIDTEVEDLKSAIDDMVRLPDVNVSKILLAGHSMGALVSLIQASYDGRVRAVAALSSPFYLGSWWSISDDEVRNLTPRELEMFRRWEDDCKKLGYFTHEYSMGSHKVSKEWFFKNWEWNKKLEKQLQRLSMPVLIVYGKGNARDLADGQALARALGNSSARVSIKEIDSDDHTYGHAGLILAAETIAQWFNAHS